MQQGSKTVKNFQPWLFVIAAAEFNFFIFRLSFVMYPGLNKRFFVCCITPFVFNNFFQIFYNFHLTNLVLCSIISLVANPANAAMAQVVEHILGKDEVTSSNLVSSSKKHLQLRVLFSSGWKIVTYMFWCKTFLLFLKKALIFISGSIIIIWYFWRDGWAGLRRTTGNRVGVNSVSGVRIPLSPPKRKSVLVRGRIFVLYSSFSIIRYSLFIQSDFRNE